MGTALSQHQVEIQRNQQAWNNKPLLRHIYSEFYRKIAAQIDPSLSGVIVEIGSGIGNLKSEFPQALCTDLFPNPWLDLICDGYDLPFLPGSVSHLILFDVFHHLEAPVAFLHEAKKVLCYGGKIIIFEPYISLFSSPVYQLFHHEPVAWNDTINLAATVPRPRSYYAAQGNATRIFFARREFHHPAYQIIHRELAASWTYLLSGGFSKPALYPMMLHPLLTSLDLVLGRIPKLFGSRCLVVLQKTC